MKSHTTMIKDLLNYLEDQFQECSCIDELEDYCHACQNYFLITQKIYNTFKIDLNQAIMKYKEVN